MNKEESLLDDEPLFRDYVVAARIASPMMTHSTIFEQAGEMLAEHRKRFPKRIK